MDAVAGVGYMLLGAAACGGVFWFVGRKRNPNQAGTSAVQPVRQENAQTVTPVAAEALESPENLPVLVPAPIPDVASYAVPNSIPSSASMPAVVPEPELATRIVVGRAADQPSFELAMLNDDVLFENSPAMSGSDQIGLMSRLGACLQAAPSLMVQRAHEGRQLMEVIISEPLSRAADGVHWRAFARKANGQVKEHALLANTDKLHALVNVSAVWQVASIIVAQKHLADISSKLSDIKRGIDELKNLHQDTIDGVIEGTYHYLRMVARSIEMGEINLDARSELESCRRDLLVASSTLGRMFEGCLRKVISHRETFGTAELLTASLARYDELDRIRTALETSFNVQALCWEVVSVFPGSKVTADLWKEQTLECVENFNRYANQVTETSEQDAVRIRSLVNSNELLALRRRSVLDRAEQSALALTSSSSAFERSVLRTSRILEHRNDQVRLGVEIVDGNVEQIRVIEGSKLPDVPQDLPKRRRKPSAKKAAKKTKGINPFLPRNPASKTPPKAEPAAKPKKSAPIVIPQTPTPLI